MSTTRPLRAALLPLLLALSLSGLGLCAGCAREEEPAGAEAWVNPDLGSTAAPVTLHASELPYSGSVTEGVNYFRIVGLPAHTPQFVAVTGKLADADLFVLGDPAFTSYLCSSVLGGAADDQCATAPSGGTELYVEVYGFHGNDTDFILDVW
jgi:hypothetical protein